MAILGPGLTRVHGSRSTRGSGVLGSGVLSKLSTPEPLTVGGVLGSGDRLVHQRL